MEEGRRGKDIQHATTVIERCLRDSEGREEKGQ